MSQIDDPSKTITGGAEQQQASISKPRGAHTRAKIASYIEQSEEGPEGKQKKKWKTKEGAASVEKQERKERKKTVRRVQAGISNAIWPPLSSDRFGLIQEELKGDAFHIIVGTTFLNRTRGSVAIPLLRQFLRDYPTPHALSLASITKISTFLRPLGLYNIRATRLHNLATTWLATPPIFGQATKKYNYPPRNTKPFPSSLLPNNGVEQGRCWEIAHLPGVGAYALDSWRIFCRDEFRRAAGERVEIGQEEWRSVVPMDKELRVYVRWMWAKEGLRWKEPGDIQQTSLSSPFFERMANTRPG
ncbi:DNA glycosylase [Morchella snyderi]|nr:DNA glycosylase [Morchella snyderi]